MHAAFAEEGDPVVVRLVLGVVFVGLFLFFTLNGYVYIVFGTWGTLFPTGGAVTARTIVFLLLYHVVAFLMYWAYFSCVCSDPGKVPSEPQQARSKWLAADEEEEAVGNSQVQWTECYHCDMTRPPRAHHCGVCGYCVMRFDHHCPWINNCVGKLNHRYFLQFLAYTSLFCFFSGFAALGWDSTLEVDQHVAARIGTLPGRYLLGLAFVQAMGITCGIIVAGFFLFHLWMVSFGLTSLDCGLWLFKGCKGNEFDRGCLGNLQEVMGSSPARWLLPLWPKREERSYRDF